MLVKSRVKCIAEVLGTTSSHNNYYSQRRISSAAREDSKTNHRLRATGNVAFCA
jgi:hypothetical protein